MAVRKIEGIKNNHRAAAMGDAPGAENAAVGLLPAEVSEVSARVSAADRKSRRDNRMGLLTNLKAAFALSAILIAGCAPAPAANSVTSASANLISAQAQATISSQSATQVAAEANQRLQEQYTHATEQAQQIYQQQQAQLNATQQAQQDAINVAMVEQARTNATASAQQQQAAVSSAWLAVTVQAQQIAATKVSFEATATKVVKETMNQATVIDASAYIDIAFRLIIEIAVPLLIIFAVLVGLRKVQQKDTIYQPHPDGPAFYYKHRLLAAPDPFVLWNPEEERFKWSIILREPPPQLPPPSGDEDRLVKVTDINGQVSYHHPISHAEARLRAYWKARVLRFLDSAIEVSGPDSQKIPRFDKMKIKSGDWVETTDALGKYIYKEERQSTLCLPPYQSLSLLRDAVANGQIIPLPHATVLPNEETQRETDNRETGQNSGKQPDNSGNRALTPSGLDPVVLAEAVKKLPELFKRSTAA